MTGRDGLPQSPMWIEAASGWLVHDPGAMNWGPRRACPVGVAVDASAGTASASHMRVVEVTLVGVEGPGTAATLLNPGAARWLGNRLIEAAVLAEATVLAGRSAAADADGAGREQLAALAAPDQEPKK